MPSEEIIKIRLAVQFSRYSESGSVRMLRTPNAALPLYKDLTLSLVRVKSEVS